MGQLLRTIFPPYAPPVLAARKKGVTAEYENQVIPIEVKAGTTGTLRSFHQCIKEKKKAMGQDTF